MVDPNSVGAILDLLGAPGKIFDAVRTIDSLIKKFKTASEDIQDLGRQLAFLKTEFTLVSEWCEKDQYTSKEVAEQLKVAILDCVKFIEDLDHHVEKLLARDSVRNRAIFVLWSEPDIQKAQKRAERHLARISRVIALIKQTAVQNETSEKYIDSEPDAKNPPRFSKYWKNFKSPKSPRPRPEPSPILTITPPPETADDESTYPTGQAYFSSHPRSLPSSPVEEKPRTPRQSLDGRAGKLKRLTSSSSLWLAFEHNLSDDMKQKRRTLVDACKNGNLELVRAQLKDRIYINGGQDTGDNPLLAAVRSPINSTQIVKLLTEAGAKANLRDSDGKTPLFYALKRTDPEMAKLLIAAEADVNSPDWAYTGDKDNAITPLCYVASLGNVGLAQILIEKGAKVNSARSKMHLLNGQGLAPMQRALGPGIASELTALHFAAAHGSSAMVELLKAKGADVSPTCDHVKERPAKNEGGDKEKDKLKRKTWKITPLHLANRSAGQALLDAGANLSAMDSKGRQLIHWAAMAQRPDAVALALGHGAEVDHRDAKMETPLSLFFKRLAKERYFMEAGPLHNQDHLEEIVSTLRELLAAKANTLLMDEKHLGKPCPLPPPRRHKGSWTWRQQILLLSR